MPTCPHCGHEEAAKPAPMNHIMRHYVKENGKDECVMNHDEDRFDSFKQVKQPDGSEQTVTTKWVRKDIYDKEQAAKAQAIAAEAAKADAAKLAIARTPIVVASATK